MNFLSKFIPCAELLVEIEGCRMGLRSHQYHHRSQPLMQNSPLALFLKETFDTRYPSQEPMDVANIIGTHVTLDSSISYEIALLGDLF